MAYDLVIRNGTVVDGSGPSFRADVAIAGDRIAEIGRITDRARSESDAEGQVVTRDSLTTIPAWTPRSSGTRWARAPRIPR